jgi:hypothetical protein
MGKNVLWQPRYPGTCFDKRSSSDSGKPGESRVIVMKCYVCAKEGKDSDAVAVCIACGMGTCMRHTIRKEVDVWEGSYPLPSRKLPKKMPRMLCPDCNAAYGEGK